VEEWRRDAAQHVVQVVGEKDWEQLGSSGDLGLCEGLCDIAAGLKLLTGSSRHAVAWVVSTLAQMFGGPLLLAKILGRLVANWLLEPVDPVDRAARRLRILGVLLCAEEGRLGFCDCLDALAFDLSVQALKDYLHEGFGETPRRRSRRTGSRTKGPHPTDPADSQKQRQGRDEPRRSGRRERGGQWDPPGAGRAGPG